MHDMPARFETKITQKQPVPGLIRALCLIVLAVLPSGCAGTGDFGRQPYSVIDDKIVPVVAKGVAHSREQPVSWYRYTEPEKSLRREARQLRNPYGRPIFLERTIRRVERANLVSNRIDWNSPARYTARLDREKFQNGSNRVQVIMSQMRDDRHFMLRFEKAMVEVLRDDRARSGHLRANRDYPARERNNAAARIEENQAVMQQTLAALDRRIDGYDEALHQTPLRFPGTNMGPPRRALLDLQDYVRKLAARLPGQDVRLAGAPAPL